MLRSGQRGRKGKKIRVDGKTAGVLVEYYKWVPPFSEKFWHPVERARKVQAGLEFSGALTGRGCSRPPAYGFTLVCLQNSRKLAEEEEEIRIRIAL